MTLVSPALDPGSTTLEVWVQARKPSTHLRPGISVQVAITAKTDKNAVVIPAGTVFKNPEGGDYVLLAGTDDKAHLKTVRVGIRNTESVEIASGIKEGDPVITSGGYAVPDGTKIKVEKPEASEKEVTSGDDKDKDDKKDEKGDEKKSGSAAKPDDKDKE